MPRGDKEKGPAMLYATPAEFVAMVGASVVGLLIADAVVRGVGKVMGKGALHARH